MAPVSPCRKNNTATKQKRQRDADGSSEVDRRPLSPGKRDPEGGRQEPAPGQQPGEELEGQSSARSARSRRKEEGFMHEGSESPQQHLTLGSQTPPLATPSQEPARFTAEEVSENRTGMRRKRNRVTAAEVNEHRLGGSDKEVQLLAQQEVTLRAEWTELDNQRQKRRRVVTPNPPTGSIASSSATRTPPENAAGAIADVVPPVVVHTTPVITRPATPTSRSNTAAEMLQRMQTPTQGPTPTPRQVRSSAASYGGRSLAVPLVSHGGNGAPEEITKKCRTKIEELVGFSTPDPGYPHARFVVSLPSLGIAPSDAVESTADAPWHIQSMATVDPITVDPGESMKVQRHFSQLYDDEEDPHMRTLVNMIAGMKTDHMFAKTPATGGDGSHAKAHTRPCE